MLLTTVRNLLAHKFRLFATGLAVMLGVAFMSGTLVLTDTIQKTFDDLFANVYDGTSAVVRQTAAFKGPNGAGDQRGRVDASLVNVVKHVDGVAVAEGNMFGYAQIVDKHGDAVGDPNNGPPVIGGDWSNVPQLNGWKLVAGTPPRGPDDVVIDKHSADKTGYHVGDTARVLVKGGAQPVTIAGIAKFGDATRRVERPSCCSRWTARNDSSVSRASSTASPSSRSPGSRSRRSRAASSRSCPPAPRP